MAGDGGEGDSEKSPFRWLAVARYAVASVVTVLIFAVIISAIKVVLRPASLSLSVTGGSLFVRRFPPPPCKSLAFDLNLRAENPIGRARMYYVNITVYLFDDNTSASSSNPNDDSIVYSNADDIVLQQQTLDYSLQLYAMNHSMNPDYFNNLYDNKSAIISDVTMRLDGLLITEVTLNKTLRTTYYCRPLLVGGDPDDKAFKKQDDVLCIKG